MPGLMTTQIAFMFCPKPRPWTQLPLSFNLLTSEDVKYATNRRKKGTTLRNNAGARCHCVHLTHLQALEDLA
jgi:hypothetical protein